MNGVFMFAAVLTLTPVVWTVLAVYVAWLAVFAAPRIIDTEKRDLQRINERNITCTK